MAGDSPKNWFSDTGSTCRWPASVYTSRTRLTASMTVLPCAHSPWSGGSRSKPLAWPLSAAVRPTKPDGGVDGKASGFGDGFGLALVLAPARVPDLRLCGVDCLRGPALDVLLRAAAASAFKLTVPRYVSRPTARGAEATAAARACGFAAEAEPAPTTGSAASTDRNAIQLDRRCIQPSPQFVT